MDLMEMRLRQQPQYWSSDYLPERKIDCPVLPPVSRPVGWNKKNRPRRDRPNVVEGFEMISPTSAMKLENHQKNWLSCLPWSYAEVVKKPNNKQNQAVTKEEDPAEGSSESSDQENMSRDAREINYHHSTNGNVSDSELNLNPDASEFIPGATSSEKDEMTTSATTCTTDEDISEEHGYTEANDTKRESSEQNHLVIDEESKNSETLTEINGNIHMGDAEYEYVKEDAATSEQKESSPFLLTNDKTNMANTAEDNLVYFEEEQSNQEEQSKEDILSDTEEIVEVEHNPLPEMDETDNLIFSTIEEEEHIHENKEGVVEMNDDGLITLGNELNFEELVKNKAIYSETHCENGELNRPIESSEKESNLMNNKEEQDDEDNSKDIENLDTNEECTFSEDYQISEELNDIKEMLENEANRNALLNKSNHQDDDGSDLVQDDLNENRMVQETSFNESINRDLIDDQGLSEEFKLNSYGNIPDENDECEKAIEQEESNYESVDDELNNEMKINENFFNEETEREDDNKVVTENINTIIEETQSETENDSLKNEDNEVGAESNVQLIETNYCDTDEEKENIEFCNIPRLNNDLPDVSTNISYDVMTTSMYESQDNDSSFEIINEPVEMKDNAEVIPAKDCEETDEIILNETSISEQFNDRNIVETYEKLVPDDRTEEEAVNFDLNNSGELLIGYVNCSDISKDDQCTPSDENSQTETSESGVLDIKLEETSIFDKSMTEEDIEQLDVQNNEETQCENTFETEQNQAPVETLEENSDEPCEFDMNQEESNIVEMSSNDAVEENKSHDMVPSTFENEQDNLAEEETIHETEDVGEMIREDELQVVPEMPTENPEEPQMVEPLQVESRLEENESNQSLSEIKEEKSEEINNIENTENAETIVDAYISADQISEENQIHQTINEIHTTEICEALETEEEAQCTQEIAPEKLSEFNTPLEENASFEKISDTNEVFINQGLGEVNTTELLPELETLPKTDDTNLEDRISLASETDLNKETINLQNSSLNLQSTPVEESQESTSCFEASLKSSEPKSDEKELLEEEKDYLPYPEPKAKEMETQLESLASPDEKSTTKSVFSALSAVAATFGFSSGDNGFQINELKPELNEPLAEEQDVSLLSELKTEQLENSVEPVVPDTNIITDTTATALSAATITTELSDGDDSFQTNDLKPELNEPLGEEQDVSLLSELKAEQLEDSVEPVVPDTNITMDTAATALSAAAITTAAAIGVAVVANTTITKNEHDAVEELKTGIETDPTENMGMISSNSLACEDLTTDNNLNKIEPTIVAQPKAPKVTKTPSAAISSPKPSTPTSKTTSKTSTVAGKPSPAKATGPAKPTTAGAKPAAATAKSAATGAKPAAAGTAKPAAATAKPAVGAKPAGATAKPAVGAKPAAAAAKPAAAGAKPAAAGAKPPPAKPGSAMKSPVTKPTTEVKSTTAVAKSATGGGKVAAATAKPPAAATAKPVAAATVKLVAAATAKLAAAATAKPAAAATAKPAAATAKPAAAATAKPSAAKPGSAAKPTTTAKPAVAKPSTPAKPGSASGVKPTSSASTAKLAAKSPAVAGTPKGSSMKPSSPTSKPGTPTSKTSVSTKPGTPPTKSTPSTPAKSTASKPGTPAKSIATKPSTPPTRSSVKPTPASPKTTTEQTKKPGSPTKQSDVSSTVSRPSSSSASEKNSVSKTNGSAHPTKSPTPKATTPKAAPVKTPAAKTGIDKTDKSKSTGNKTQTKVKTPAKKPSITADKNAKNNLKSATKDIDTSAKNDVGECEAAVTSTTTGDLPIENGTHVEELRPQIIV